MKALNNFIIEDFKNHLISTADYVKSMQEKEYDFTSTNDMLRQVWETAVETFEGDNIQWGSEKEELYGEVFDDMESFIFDILA
jgi:hypothetical protein